MPTNLRVMAWNLHYLGNESTMERHQEVQVLTGRKAGDTDVFMFCELTHASANNVLQHIAAYAQNGDGAAWSYQHQNPGPFDSNGRPTQRESYGFVYRQSLTVTSNIQVSVLMEDNPRTGNRSQGRSQILGGRQAVYMTIEGFSLYIVHPSPDNLTGRELQGMRSWLGSQTATIIGGDFNTLLINGPQTSAPAFSTQRTNPDPIDGFIFTADVTASGARSTRVLRSTGSDHSWVYDEFQRP